MIKDQKAGNPSKPWYMWFCPGANHAPHHAPQEYIDKYKGKFDDGYEAYREWVLPRMIAKGLLPEGTLLTPINPMPADVASPSDMVRPWNSLSADEKKLFSRLMEVYAGFSDTRTLRLAASSIISSRAANWRTRLSSTVPTTGPPVKAAPTVR